MEKRFVGIREMSLTPLALMASVEGIIGQWAGTSSFTLSQQQAEGKGYELIYLPQGMSWQEGLGYIPSDGTPGGVASPEQIAHLAAMQAKQGRLEALLGVLERFNGQGFVNRAGNDEEWRERA